MTSITLAARHALLACSQSESSDLDRLLRGMGYLPVQGGSVTLVREVHDPIALCIVDLRDNGEALRIVRAMRAQQRGAVIIGVADPERPTLSADAIRAGVFDVLPRPVSARDLEALIANAHEQAALAATPRGGAAEANSFGIVGPSPAMRGVMDLVQRAAAGRCSILICGERGTGREMLARAIHSYGSDPHAPFVKVDCSNPALEDVELQLFGRLTGGDSHPASERRSLERIGERCSLRSANGGILFLENVTDLHARAQARLVRVLRDREMLVGDSPDAEPLRLRPIASADGSIEAALEEGRLRPDLYERLSLVRVDVPALRQRREDIPVLATHFLKELCTANGKPLKTLTRPALTLLAALPWRGNAPELRSLLERLILLVPQGLVRLEDILAHTQLEGTLSPSGVDATLRQARARFERDYIAAVLQHQHWRIAEAARVLGIQRTNLYRKMRRLNLMRGKSGREA